MRERDTIDYTMILREEKLSDQYSLKLWLVYRYSYNAEFHVYVCDRKLKHESEIDDDAVIRFRETDKYNDAIDCFENILSFCHKLLAEKKGAQ